MAKKIMDGGNKKVNSDSLMRSSESKKRMAFEQERLGMAQIKNKVKPGQTGTSKYKGSLGTPYPVGKERLDIAKNMRKEATKDSLAAVKGYPKGMSTKTPKKLSGTPVIVGGIGSKKPIKSTPPPMKTAPVLNNRPAVRSAAVESLKQEAMQKLKKNN